MCDEETRQHENPESKERNSGQTQIANYSNKLTFIFFVDLALSNSFIHFGVLAFAGEFWLFWYQSYM